MSVYVGMDIGGTKCAVSIGAQTEEGFSIVAREETPTPKAQEAAIDWLCSQAEKLCEGQTIAGVGISAGGPLDAERGELQNPPNLPGWQGLSLTGIASKRLHAPCVLENDA
ncbi:MAG: ROK family protein, partial [Eubacteriales bacterium]|nr:ROK family protein [Eubacteriales bacterium]